MQDQSLVQATRSGPTEPLSRVQLTPVNGIDYIIDYYAVLDVPRTATTEEIHKSFRRLSAEWHPDKYAALAAPLQKQAERHYKLLTEADEVLTTPERRKLHDELLATFPSELVSKNGTAILDLKRRRIDLQLLITGGERDSSAVEARLKTLSGYDENTYGLLKNLVSATAEPSAELKAAYRAAVEKRFTYLTLKEDIIWSSIGIDNQQGVKGIFTPEEHIQARRAQFENVGIEVVEAIDRSTRLLGSGEAMRLLGGESETLTGAEVPAQVAKEKLVELALARLKTVESRIVAAASNTAMATEELLSLTSWSYDPKVPATLTDNLIVAVVHSGRILIGVQCINVNGVAEAETLDAGNGLSLVEGIQALRQVAGSEATYATLELNPELDIMMQVSYVLSKHLEAKTGSPTEIAGRVSE